MGLMPEESFVPELDPCPYGMCNPRLNTSGHDYCKRMFAVRFRRYVTEKYGGDRVDIEPNSEDFEVRFDAWVTLHGPIDTALDSGVITYLWSAEGTKGENSWDVFVDQMPARRR